MASKHSTPARGLTDKFLQNKRTTKSYVDIADKGCPGLVARVHKSGAISFRWTYRDKTTGKNRVKTLGRYGRREGCISLKQAREQLDKDRAKHQAGEPVGSVQGTPETVTELAEVFYERRIKPHRKRPEIVRAVLDNDIIPAIGRRKLNTLTAPTVAHVVEAVVDRGAETHAGKVLATLKQMFRFAEGRGYIHHSPAYALDRKDLGVVANVRERYLDAEEIRIFWQAIDRAPRMSEQSRIGFRILLLTGVRVGELLQAKWEHIDLDKGEWFIPEENSKTRAWTVPLVPAVKRLFKSLQGLDDVYVMAGKEKGAHMTDKALSRALARLFTLGNGDPLLPVEKFTLHDFRRTLRTHADDLDIEPHIAEKCLNHSLGHIEKTYNRNTLLKKRREALKKWADYVDLVVTERENVKVLRHG